MISVHFQGKPFNITVIQVYVPTSNVEEDEDDYEVISDDVEEDVDAVINEIDEDYLN